MLQTYVTSARLDEQHQGPGLKAHVMLNLRSHLDILNSSSCALSYQKNYPRVFCLVPCRKLLYHFPPFFPSLLLGFRTCIPMPDAAIFNLGDHLPLDNTAVKQSVPTNNIYKKDGGIFGGTVFTSGFSHQVSRNILL